VVAPQPLLQGSGGPAEGGDGVAAARVGGGEVGKVPESGTVGEDAPRAGGGGGGGGMAGSPSPVRRGTIRGHWVSPP
jgi:hypothetical protein